MKNDNTDEEWKERVDEYKIWSNLGSSFIVTLLAPGSETEAAKGYNEGQW